MGEPLALFGALCWSDFALWPAAGRTTRELGAWHITERITAAETPAHLGCWSIAALVFIPCSANIWDMLGPYAPRRWKVVRRQARVEVCAILPRRQAR